MSRSRRSQRDTQPTPVLRKSTRLSTRRASQEIPDVSRTSSVQRIAAEGSKTRSTTAEVDTIAEEIHLNDTFVFYDKHNKPFIVQAYEPGMSTSHVACTYHLPKCQI